MRQSPPNARFWAYVNQGPVKITLKPNQVLSHVEGGPTDEGWSYHATCWDHEGDRVTREYTSNACDCDGRLDRFRDDECPIELLRTGNCPYIEDPKERACWEGVVYPEWQSVRRCQRDYSAEAMGY